MTTARPTTKRSSAAERDGIERFFDNLDELMLYRYPHVFGPLLIAGVVALGGAWLAYTFDFAWALTVVAAIVFLIGMGCVPDLPGPRERLYAHCCWVGGTSWVVLAAWIGPFAGPPLGPTLGSWQPPLMFIAWFVLLACGWPPFFKHRRVRRGVRVSAEISAWDGDAVGLAGVELVKASAKADQNGWSARLRVSPKGRYTLSQLRNAIPRIAARYNAAQADVEINMIREGKEGEYELQIREAPPDPSTPYECPEERPTLAVPFRIGRLNQGGGQLMSELYRPDWGGVDGLVAGMKGYGKSLSVQVPVPTPTGWTTMGAIQDGDVILDDQGQPCRVIKAHEVRYNRPCYRVTFSDGSTIIADGDHNWLTEDLPYRVARSNRATNPRGAPARRLRLQADRIGPLGGLVRRQPEATLAEVCEVAGIDWNGALAQQVAREVGAFGIKRWPTTFTRRDGRVVNRKAWARTYCTADLVERLIAVGSRPAHDQRDRALSPQVRTTDEIRATLRVGEHFNHAVRNARPLQLPDAELPVPPYVLGAWLGDGSSSDGTLASADPEMRLHIEGCGYQTGPNLQNRGEVCEVYTIYGLAKGLRAAGVLHNKHIPSAYLRASEAQRRALLAGLLDTDGTVGLSGQVQFTATREWLAREVRELAASLGYRPTLTSRPARYNGKVTGTAWTVGFGTTDPVFWLSRKVEAHKLRTVRHNPERNATRAIVAVDPVPSVPVRCLTVDSPSRLYLVGETMIPTHNTGYFRRLALQTIASRDGLLFMADMKPGSPDYHAIGGRGGYVYATTQAEVDLIVRALLIICGARGRAKRRERMKLVFELDESSLYFRPTEAASDDYEGRRAAKRADTARQANWESLIAISRSYGIAIRVATQQGKEARLGNARSFLLAGEVTGFFSPKGSDSALLSSEGEFNLASLPRGVPGECLLSNGQHPDVVRGRIDHVTEAVERQVLKRFANGQGDLEDDELAALEAELGGAWTALRAANRRRPPVVSVPTPPAAPETPAVGEVPAVEAEEAEEVEEVPRRLTPEQSRDLVWGALAECDRPTYARDIATMVDKSEDVVRPRLKELVEEQRAVAHSRGRWTKYEAVRPALDEPGGPAGAAPAVEVDEGKGRRSDGT